MNLCVFRREYSGDGEESVPLTSDNYEATDQSPYQEVTRYSPSSTAAPKAATQMGYTR